MHWFNNVAVAEKEIQNYAIVVIYPRSIKGGRGQLQIVIDFVKGINNRNYCLANNAEISISVNLLNVLSDFISVSVFVSQLLVSPL